MLKIFSKLYINRYAIQAELVSKNFSFLYKNFLINFICLNIVEVEKYKLPEEQIVKLKIIFNKFDKNGDGKITADELGDVMAKAGYRVSKDQLRELIDSVDQDGSFQNVWCRYFVFVWNYFTHFLGNGAVEFDEFVYLFSQKPQEDMEKEAIQAFGVRSVSLIT